MALCHAVLSLSKVTQRTSRPRIAEYSTIPEKLMETVFEHSPITCICADCGVVSPLAEAILTRDSFRVSWRSQRLLPLQCAGFSPPSGVWEQKQSRHFHRHPRHVLLIRIYLVPSSPTLSSRPTPQLTHSSPLPLLLTTTPLKPQCEKIASRS